MSTVDRRYFIMSSVALPSALKASALQSPNDTVRVAVVGFNGRGRAHIQAYLKTPNVEIAALCDVDQSVIDSGCKTIESAGKKRPATYTDFRKLLEDKQRKADAESLPQLNTDTWRVGSDGRMETTYRLRPNLTWHDGAPLTAPLHP